MHPEAGLADIRKDRVPHFEIGDTVDVHVKIREGEKERIQVFTGTVIARRGSGLSASFTVRRVVQGHGVERVFPLHAPTVTGVTVKRHGKTRRAKLYFLRDRIGKAVRLRERLRKKGVVVAGEDEAVDAEEAQLAAEAAEAEAEAKASEQPASDAPAAPEAQPTEEPPTEQPPAEEPAAEEPAAEATSE